MRLTEDDYELKKILVTSSFPLFFYKKCHSCEQRIKKESMWRCIYWDDIWNEIEIMHLCTECCKTPKDAKEYVKNWGC